MLSNLIKKEEGFTLIELLVVIAIIGILSSVVLASLSNARASARDAQRKQDLRQIRAALNMYYNDYGDYMQSGSGCGWEGDGYGWFNSGGGSYTKAMSQCLVDQGYTSSEIIDPSGNKTGGPGNPAYMKYTCSKGTFIYAELETEPNGADALPSDVCKSGSDTTGHDEKYGVNYYLQVD